MSRSVFATQYGPGYDMNRVPRTITLTGLLAWLFAAALLPAGVPAAQAQPEAEPEPVTMLREMTEYLQGVVRDDSTILNDPVRLRALANEVVLPHVDFVSLSRWVLGKNWRKATPQQREAFMAEFREMLMLDYLGRVTSYRESEVRFLPLRPGSREEREVVQAEVEPEGAPVINVLFRLHRVDGQWLVYDIAVEGISLVATHRSGFTEEISRHGIDGLIARLAERNQAESGVTEPAGKCTNC